MKRAMRIDKVTIAALSATLQLYLDPDKVADRVPTLKFLVRKSEEIRKIARRVEQSLGSTLGNEFSIKQVECLSQIGSGSLPVERLPSVALSISPLNGKKGSKLKKYAEAFRSLPIPVIGRIQGDAFILDMRCLDNIDDFLAQLSKLKL